MNIWYLYTHIYKKNTKHLYGLMRHIDIIYETFCYLNFVLRTNKYYTFMKTKTSTKIISLRRYRDERFPSAVVFLCFQFQRLYLIYIFWRLRGSYIKIEILYKFQCFTWVCKFQKQSFSNRIINTINRSLW